MMYAVSVPCPNCHEEHGGKIVMVVTHDPGYWRNGNGDGLPPSTDVECETVCDVCGGDAELSAAQCATVEDLALGADTPSNDGPDEEPDDDPWDDPGFNYDVNGRCAP